MSKTPKEVKTETTTPVLKKIKIWGPLSFGSSTTIKGKVLSVQFINGGPCVITEIVGDEDSALSMDVMPINSEDSHSGDYIGTSIDGPWMFHVVTYSYTK